ncbi:hypothetical protein P280DRAFT_484653 [Massarina eburnea CBS 473.64]|uniref:Uncharacterized protein n=1 Tax=Massarina eburnea CBS 473.64 TaxID=1395130 RepID=A0A6A6RMQ1_9PLEO|nr:hypothetical protein P280DRAFT_484653 [Massarina eburnea CBS 473.64]
MANPKRIRVSPRRIAPSNLMNVPQGQQNDGTIAGVEGEGSGSVTGALAAENDIGVPGRVEGEGGGTPQDRGSHDEELAAAPPAKVTKSNKKNTTAAVKPRGKENVKGKGVQMVKPKDPLKKGHWEDDLRKKDFPAWLERMKQMLLENLRYCRNEITKDEAARGRLEDHRNAQQNEWGKNWENKTDIETGDIYDPNTAKDMKASLNSKKIQGPFDFQFAWEDFLYYQNEWNRPRKGRSFIRQFQDGPQPGEEANFNQDKIGIDTGSEAYDDFLEYIIKTFSDAGLGSRSNAPKMLRPEDLYRFPDNIRKTTRNLVRLEHLERRFPGLRTVSNESGLNLSFEHMNTVNEEDINARKDDVDNGKRLEELEELKTQGLQIPDEQNNYTLYHAATEFSRPFIWPGTDNQEVALGTSFEEYKWGPAVTRGSWIRGEGIEINKPRYRWRTDYEPGKQEEYVIDEYGHRILDRKTKRWRTRTTDVRLLKIRKFELGENGKRIDSGERSYRYPDVRFIPGSESDQTVQPGRRDRADEHNHPDEFSEGDDDFHDDGHAREDENAKGRRGKGRFELRTTARPGAKSSTSGTNQAGGQPKPNIPSKGDRPGAPLTTSDAHPAGGQPKPAIPSKGDVAKTGAVETNKAKRKAPDKEKAADIEEPPRKKTKANSKSYEPQEMNQLLQFTQDYIREHGLEAVGTDAGQTLFYQRATKRLTAVRTELSWKFPNRTAQGVATQLKKDPDWARMLIEAAEIKRRVDENEDVPEEERKPTLRLGEYE